MLKKLTLILVIAVLAYSQVGYYFVIHHSQSVQKKMIRKRILSQLKNTELDAISLTNIQQKIYWEEDGKEFLLNGAMYDVVKIKTVNGKTILYCINDKKEKALIDNYNLITKQNSSDSKKSKDNIDNSITLFIEPAAGINSMGQTIFAQNFPTPHPYFPSALIKDISPPPKA